jgi:hypothetical protein
MANEKQVLTNCQRLIDANELQRNIDCCDIDTYDDMCTIAEQIKDAPTVDAVEVVHCCDCQNCTAFQQFADSEVLLFCEKWKGHPLVDPTDFCSYGERREGE